MPAVSDRFSLVVSIPKDLNRDMEGGAGGNHEIASQSLIKIEMVKWHQSKLCYSSTYIAMYHISSGGSRGFHWFPRKPPFKSEDYFNTYIYAAIKNILCTVTQPFLIN